MNLEQIINVLEKAQHVLVAAHVSPDGDAIGAMASAGHILNALDVSYTILIEENNPKLQYITDKVNVQSEYVGEYDVFLSVDCGDTKRLGIYNSYFEKAPITINIDHHITNEHFAMYNYVQAEASSTCEVMYHLSKAGEVMMTRELAEALYTGILTDTGGFMHPCTQPSTMRAVAELISYPFDYSGIYHKLLHEKSLKMMQMENKAISHLEILGNHNVYFSYVTADEMAKYDVTKHDLEGVISTIRNIEGAEIVAFIYPMSEAGTFKLSTRSIAPYDVAKLCQSFGGGGHQRAAGATLVGDLNQLMTQVKVALEDLAKEGRD